MLSQATTLFAIAAAGIGVAATTQRTPTAPSLGVSQDIQQSWGHYAPYFAVAPYKAPPEGCQVAQVNVLQSSGARYPDTGGDAAIRSTLKKFKNATSFEAPFDFVKTYDYTLGTVELVAFGAAQSLDAGQEHYLRYGSLVNKTMPPFVRSTNNSEVASSATNWTVGFFQAANSSGNPLVATVSVIMPRASNNTLDDSICPLGTKSRAQRVTWAGMFGSSIAARFNSSVHGANMDSTDVVNLMSLCALEVVAKQGPSPWCDLFSSEEWSSYEYFSDLGDYYGNGYGQPLGRVQGVGFVNELIARLTGQPVQDATQTNHTLDNSTATFPLNRTFYADFSDGYQAISIYAALGLFKQPKDLDPTKPDSNRTWITSKMTPSSGRLIAEKLTCEGKQEPYVRVLINDAVYDMDFCCADENGLCTLSAFVDSQKYARENGQGDWEKCGYKPAN